MALVGAQMVSTLLREQSAFPKLVSRSSPVTVNVPMRATLVTPMLVKIGSVPEIGPSMPELKSWLRASASSWPAVMVLSCAGNLPVNREPMRAKVTSAPSCLRSISPPAGAVTGLAWKCSTRTGP